MPTYSYACTECGNRFDVVQAFTDDALTTCDRCSGRLRKLFSPVGVVFKGSGFYHNDSRTSSKAATNGHSKSSGSNGSETDTGNKSASGETSGSAEKTGASADKGDKSTAGAGSTAAAATST